MKYIKRIGTYVFLTLFSIWSILPIYYAICKASGGNTDMQKGPMLPGLRLWDNLSHILFQTPFLSSFLYTLAYTSVQTLLTLFVCALAGYGFELYHDKAKDNFFKLILWIYMIPFTTLVVPTFVIFKGFHLINTTAGIILPFIASPLIIMIFRQQSRSFPMEVIEAARMDGLREPFIFLRMYLPNMKATMACGVIITFLHAWNSYQWPSIIMLNDGSIPMTVYLTLGHKGDRMTLVLLSMLPSMLVFFALQKYFVKGMGSAVE